MDLDHLAYLYANIACSQILMSLLFWPQSAIPAFASTVPNQYSTQQGHHAMAMWSVARCFVHKVRAQREPSFGNNAVKFIVINQVSCEILSAELTDVRRC